MTIAENWPTQENPSVLMVGGQTYTHRSKCGKLAREIGRINSHTPRVFACRLGDLGGLAHAEDTVMLTEDLRYGKDGGIVLVKGALEEQPAFTKLSEVDLGFVPNNTVVFKDGHTYTHRTRDGRFARIIETGRKHGQFTVIALVATAKGSEIVVTYTEDLRYGPDSGDYCMDLIKGASPSIDWPKVNKGTPVRFYSRRGELSGVFNGPNEQGQLTCKVDGGLVQHVVSLSNLTIA